MSNRLTWMLVALTLWAATALVWALARILRQPSAREPDPIDADIIVQFRPGVPMAMMQGFIDAVPHDMRGLCYAFIIAPGTYVTEDACIAFSAFGGGTKARYTTLVAAIRDEKLAARVAHVGHAPHHDVRWCGACEDRLGGIDDYRQALERVITDCDNEPDGDALLQQSAPE